MSRNTIKRNALMLLVAFASVFGNGIQSASADVLDEYLIAGGQFSSRGRPVNGPCITKAFYVERFDGYEWSCNGRDTARISSPSGIGIQNDVVVQRGIQYYENHTEYGVKHHFIYIVEDTFLVLTNFISSSELESRVELYVDALLSWDEISEVFREYDVPQIIGDDEIIPLVRRIFSELQ